MLLASPCLVFAQNATDSTIESTSGNAVAEHDLLDPLTKQPHLWHSSVLKPGWGITGEFFPALSKIGDDEHTMRARDNFIITGYYDTWALSFLTRHHFTGARLAFRDTKSRDLMSAWYFVGGSSREIKEDNITLKSGTTLGIGARSVFGYDSQASFALTYDFELGISSTGNVTNPYLYSQLFLGMRIPISSVAITLGGFIDGSLGPTGVEEGSDYDSILGEYVYTYGPEIGFLGALGLSISMSFNGNVLQ